MKMTTDCRGRAMDDGARKVEGTGPHRRLPSVNRLLFSVLCLSVLLGGCGKKALEQAQQEAREAKTTVQQLKHNLGLAQKEITNIKAELNAVRQSRDELQEKIDQAAKERDQAVEFAQKAQEAMNAQSSGQMSATASLQRQIAELKVLVAEQQKQIDQQKEAAAVPAAVPPNQTPVADPNEGL